MSDKVEVSIYTDGACSGNPGKGGYGTILMAQDEAGNVHKKELTQGTYRYVLETLNVETTSSTNDTLEFSYLQGTFAGFFRSATNQITKQALKIALTTQACPVLIPESLFEKQVCGKADNRGTISVEPFLYNPKYECLLYLLI